MFFRRPLYFFSIYKSIHYDSNPRNLTTLCTLLAAGQTFETHFQCHFRHSLRLCNMDDMYLPFINTYSTCVQRTRCASPACKMCNSLGIWRTSNICYYCRSRKFRLIYYTSCFSWRLSLPVRWNTTSLRNRPEKRLKPTRYNKCFLILQVQMRTHLKNQNLSISQEPYTKTSILRRNCYWVTSRRK